MKNAWLKYCAKFDALSPRERISAFAALVLLCVYLVYAVGIEPAQGRAARLRKQIIEQQSELKGLQPPANLARNAGPDAANRSRAEALKANLDALDEKLKAVQRELVSAERMGALLQDVLVREPGLQLVGMRTLAAVPLLAEADRQQAGSAVSAAEQPKYNPAQPAVYKHGVEITIRGSYAHLHGYLTRLERLPWRMFWWRAKLIASEEGPLTMVITIYTLSMDRAWLQV
jgi:MSHA biogenesis protein MshJ